MKVTALQSHGWKKGDVLLNLCWCSRGGSNGSTSLYFGKNISIIYFAFAEKSGMSFSCFACVFVCARS